MARDHQGRLFSSLWDDDDFVATSLEAKAVFGFLLSQPDLEHDGVVVIRVPTWADMLNTSPENLVRLLTELHDARFIVMDWRQMHILVRSKIRRDKVYRQPNVFKSAVEHIYTVKSRPIRAVLLSELERLDESEMNAETREIRCDVMDWLRRGSDNPSPNPSGNGSPKTIRPDFENAQQWAGPQEPLSEIRQSQEIDAVVIEVSFDAGQGMDGNPSDNTSGNGSSRARSLTTTPIPNQEQNLLTSVTATPLPDEPSASKPRGKQKPKASARPKAEAEPRPDVEALCNRLVELMVENGSDKPKISDAWRTQARLLLDKDQEEFGNREFDKAMRLLEWALKHHFWWRNIRSIPKFRAKYGQLRDQANDEWARNRPPKPDSAPASTEITPFGGNVVAIRSGIPAPRSSTTDRAVASGDAALAEFRRMTGRTA
jgi:hypothetical protein